MLKALREKLGRAHVRTEVAWVVAHKVAEFLIVFATLKAFTHFMPKAVFGEYQLALGGLMLLTHLSAAPITQAFLRLYNEAKKLDAVRALFNAVGHANTRVAWITAVVAAAVTIPASRLLGLETLTVLATGLIVLGNRWRSLWIYLLDIRRERRTCALQNLGFFFGILLATPAVLYLAGPSATAALLTYGGVAGAFGYLGHRGFESIRRSAREDGAPIDFAGAYWTFGVPIGALLTCQWLQSFAERYVLGIQVELAEVGRYVAGYQVGGAPYMMLYAVITGLVVPVAYQRAGAGQATAMRAADRILLGGTAAYLLAGFAFLPVFGIWGHEIMRLLTNPEYALPADTVLAIAVSRFLNFLCLVLHTFFFLHKRTTSLLITSAAVALLSVPVYWWSISVGAIRGAAIGVSCTATLYVLLMVFAPGGVVWLLRDSRNPRASTSEDARDSIVPEPT